MVWLFLACLLPAHSQINPNIKIPYEKLGHLIMVKVKINDSDSVFNFIIDTGGSTFIDKNIAKELELKEQGPMAKITTMDVSGYQIQNVFCFTTFNFDIFKLLGRPIHGIIGSNLMERYKVTFDFLSHQVIFSNDTTAIEPQENAMYFVFRNHTVNNAPIIPLRLNNNMIEGMIDTGQPYPLVLPIKDAGDYKKTEHSGFIRSTGIMESWPQTNPTHNYIARFPTCILGNQTISDIYCLFSELPPMLSMPLIGMDLLSQYKMIINYPKDEMVLIPIPGFRLKNNIYTVGLNPEISEEGKVFVKGVWEHSPADEARIQIGDQIIAFESRVATSENLNELMQLMENDHIKQIHLVIRNKEGQKKIKLKKKMLF